MASGLYDWRRAITTNHYPARLQTVPEKIYDVDGLMARDMLMFAERSPNVRRWIGRRLYNELGSNPMACLVMAFFVIDDGDARCVGDLTVPNIKCSVVLTSQSSRIRFATEFSIQPSHRPCTMSSKLIAIIAGAGAGTGASVARKFATTYPVVLLARNPDSYESLAREINAGGGKALGISTDISSSTSVKNAVSTIHGEFGSDVGAAVSVDLWKAESGLACNVSTGGYLQRQRRLQADALPGAQRG